jgi:hypothetical protein
VIDVHVVDMFDDMDMELARELRRADNGGRDVVVQEEDVLAPYLREEEGEKGRRELEGDDEEAEEGEGEEEAEE